eukprot:COSAG01_NODE_12655_length_1703_cov_1.718204_1_plen_51_part_00
MQGTTGGAAAYLGLLSLLTRVLFSGRKAPIFTCDIDNIIIIIILLTKIKD